MRGTTKQVKRNEISLNTAQRIELRTALSTPVTAPFLLAACELQPWNGRSTSQVDQSYGTGCGEIPHFCAPAEDIFQEERAPCGKKMMGPFCGRPFLAAIRCCGIG